MITGGELTSVLYALATGCPDRADNVVVTSESLEDELRSALLSVLAGSDDPSLVAEGIGRSLRAHGANQFLVNECYRAAFYLGSSWSELAHNPLYAHFLANRSAAVLDKWIHYFPIYERHLAPYRDKPINVLEIGTYRGGGLHMLRSFLGDKARIVGLDVDPLAVASVAGQYVVELGDQQDPDVLRAINRKHGPFDVVIDDGGHTMGQQIVTTETLFPLINDGGLLLVEDCHTSYWPEYDGGLRREGTFIEWAKDRADDLHSRYDNSIDDDTVWATGLGGVHMYDSIVVFDRSDRFRAFNEMSGSSSFMFADRFNEGLGVELVGTRDAAQAQVAALREEVAALRAGMPAVQPDHDAEELREQIRVLHGDLVTARKQLSDAGVELADRTDELERTRGKLLESWEHTKQIRKTISWRITAPLRMVRGVRR